ncbi:MAG TPA: NHL repeat-containing protein [Solirubrobacterales bacterium]|nr:NHL repeat-containing protein [Solirubrobacterales bacterium]
MRMRVLRRRLAIATLALLALGTSAVPAQAAPSDPLFVFSPIRPGNPFTPVLPPPGGTLNGPCGLGVDSTGHYYVSDYYRHAVDVFDQNAGYGPPPQFGMIAYITQVPDVDPLDGPCGLAFDAADNLYVNAYHRSVIKYGPRPNFGSGTVIAGAGVDSTHPTGVAVDPATGNVYVNARTHIAVYDSGGAPVMDGGEPLRIGLGSLQDGYGIAFSQHPGTLGRLYVPDAGTDTVKIYDPAVDKAAPVAEIDGSATPQGEFVSLRDAAVAVDRVSGEVYVLDNLEPHFAEQPDGIVHVFAPGGAYEGHLKHLIRHALPSGLAVDNTATATQGRVYVTSGNTDGSSVYAYPPGAATTAPPLPTASKLPGQGGSVEAEVESAAPADQPASVPARPTAIAHASQGETQQVGNMLLSVSAKLAPKKLPRDRRAPVAVSVGWKISSTDGSEPPKLKTIGIEINRNGILDATGLPACPYRRIQPASTSRALANCRASLVGTGSFSALVGLEGQERYVAKGKMLVFNGVEKGKPVLYGQLYSSFPFANSFVIPFAISRTKRGAYGTTLRARLPANLRAWGNLTEVEMRLSRKYAHRGKRRSFLSASCPTPKGVGLAIFRLAKTSFAFSGGTDVSSTLTETCKVRR